MRKSQKCWSTNEIQNGILKPDSSSPYSRANKRLIKISSKVTAEKVNNGGNYTIYNIILTTEFNEWTVQKRYSEFNDLNQSLIKKIPEINKHFPPKRFFKNSDETIDERVRYFNNYLHCLFNEYNIFLFDEVIDFICIDKKILELAISKHTMGNNNKENEALYDTVKKSIQHLSKNERTVSLDKNEGKNKSQDIFGDNDSLSNKIKENSSNNNNNINLNTEINKNNILKKNSSNNINGDIFKIRNKNYFSNLFEYEKSKLDLAYEREAKPDESPFSKIVEEFLKILNQKNENKTAIIKSFEEFLKSGNYLPRFSQNDIIKLFLGIKNYKKPMVANKSQKEIKKIEKNDEKNEKNEKNEKSENEKNEKSEKNEKNDSAVRRAITSKVIKGKIIKNKELTKSFGKQKVDNDDINISGQSSSDIDEESSNNAINTSHTCNLLGLFELIGNYNKNILLSVTCLDLLVKLLSYEYNPAAEYYDDIFKGRRITDIENIKLEEIIKSNVGGAKSTYNAMKILLILFRDNPRYELFRTMIIKDNTVFKKFKIFEKNYYS